MIGAFGVSVACGAQPIPDAPITLAPSQILSGTFTYRGLTITDAVFTSVHAPTTISISRTLWHGAPRSSRCATVHPPPAFSLIR